MLGLGSALSKIGGASLGVGLAGVVPLLGLLKSGAERAEQIGDLADVFGMTPESASKLASAFEIAGGSIEEFEMSLSKLAAVSKGDEPLDETLLRVADALGEIDDAAERFQAAKEIFGAKFAGKFIDNGGDIKGLLADAPALTKQQIEQSKQLNQEFAKTGIVLKSALLPVLEILLPIVKAGAEFVRQNAALLITVLAAAAGLATFGAVAGAAGLALSAIATAAGVVLTPVGLLVAAVIGLGAHLATTTDEGKASLAAFGETFRQVADVAVEAWGGIAAAIKSGNLELAMEIAGKGITAIWAELMLGLRKGWNDFVRWLVGFLKANPWVLPAIGAAVGFAVGGAPAHWPGPPPAGPGRWRSTSIRTRSSPACRWT